MKDSPATTPAPPTKQPYIPISTRKAKTTFDQIDLLKVEELAAKRIPEAAIARLVGCSEKAWHNWKKQHQSLFTAIKNGRAQAVAKLADLVAGHLEDGNVILTAFALKQPPEHGGLGWIDERSIRHSGEITHVLTPAQEAWKGRREGQALPPPPEQEVIDVTPQEGDS